MIYAATAKGGYKMPITYDINSKRYVGIMYRPPVWTTATVYYRRSDDDFDVVIPTVFNGFYYEVVSPGLSGATEPTWPTTVDEEVGGNGEPVFKAKAYNLLPASQTITASTWTASDSVTLTNSAFTTTSTMTFISAVPAGVETFTLTNHYTASNGEEDDVSIVFKVGQR